MNAPERVVGELAEENISSTPLKTTIWRFCCGTSQRLYWSILTASIFGAVTFWALLVGFGRPLVLEGFNFFYANLPLMLPILSVVLVILLKPADLKTTNGLLDLSNQFALGWVSFAIWAFVSAQTSTGQYVAINPDKFMAKHHAILLVPGAFIWAAFCHIVTGAAKMIDGEPDRRRWQIVATALVPLSSAFMITPYFLFETKKDVEAQLGVALDKALYRVSIGFRDPSLNQHVGRTQTPIMQTLIVELSAGSAKEAKDLAKKKLSELGLSTQKWTRTTEIELPVDIVDGWLVAEKLDTP